MFWIGWMRRRDLYGRSYYGHVCVLRGSLGTFVSVHLRGDYAGKGERAVVGGVSGGRFAYV